MKNSTRGLLTFLALIMISVSVYSQKISIQGILKDGDGAAVADGSYDLTFSLYDAENGGNQVWTETQAGIQVRGGIYSAKLGEVTSFNGVLFDVTYFLGVRINGGTELTPRTELSYSPYALAVGNSATSTLANKASTLAQGGGNGTPMTFHWSGQAGQPNWLWGGNGNGTEQYVYNPSEFHVHYANYAGLSHRLRQNGDGAEMTFYWHGQGGQPSWVWGGEDGISHRVYNPANFSVNYANSAGHANTAAGLTGTPHIHAGYLRIGTKTLALNEYDGLTMHTNTAALIPDADPVSPWPYAGRVAYWYPATVKNTLGARPKVSMIAEGEIIAQHFFAYSDRRMKNRIERSPVKIDRKRLAQLEVVDYGHIDIVKDGSRQRRGFIAQEVAEIFPEAVTLQTKNVPDIYEFPVSVSVENDGRVITLSKDHQLKVGDKVSIVLEEGEKLFTVTACPDSNKFIVEGLPEKVNKMFVYGRQVDDFHVLNYDYIYTTGISVIQELIKEVTGLEENNQTLVVQQETEREKLSSLEKRLARLERLLSDRNQKHIDSLED